MGFRAEALNLYHPEAQIPFPPEEYRRRRNAVRKAMAKEKIDLLYCTSPESLFYLTGYQSNQYEQESPIGILPISGVALKQDADKLILFDSEAEEIKAHSYTIDTDIRIHRSEFPTSELEFIVNNLKEEGWLRGTVGFEKWSNRPNPALSQMFQAALEKERCRVVDSTNIVREVRVVKSPQEMSYTRNAAKIADIGMKAAFDHISPGMTELEVRAEIDYACAKAGGEHPGEPTFLLAGQRSAHPHAPSSRYVIMPGDIVRIDLCGVYHRYHAVMARTLSIGEPHPDVAKQIDLAAKSWSELSKSILPNCPLLEFSQAMEEYYRTAGILEDAWWVGGYELGIAFPPDWVGVFFYGMGKESEGRILVPGTVINYESDLYLPEGAGMSEITDTIAITESSVEILSKIPRDLVVVEV